MKPPRQWYAYRRTDNKVAIIARKSLTILRGTRKMELVRDFF